MAVHPRALQYAKAGSVFPFLFHKINALQRVYPTSSPPLLGDNDAEVMQRRLWDAGTVFQSLGGDGKMYLRCMVTRAHVVLQIQVPERLCTETCADVLPSSLGKLILTRHCASLCCAPDVPRMWRTVHEACRIKNTRKPLGC